MKLGGSSSTRQFGQTRLPSSFFSKSSRVPDGEDDQTKPSKKEPVSFSEFLNRKLNKAGGDRKIKEKPSSFSSVRSSINNVSGNERDESCSSYTLDETIFSKFNVPAQKDGPKVNGAIHEDGEDMSIPAMEPAREDNVSRKRKNLFEAPSATKYLVVLGDDPKPKPRARVRGQGMKIKRELITPPYDHYANGSGWWDCDREGIDNEEVGCSEVWEGMGSTTLGGLDWH